MKNRRYKGVVVGCGAIGALLEADPKRPKPATHAGALTKNPHTELVALVDTDAKKLAATARLFPGAKAYRDLAECLRNEKPDIVAVATEARSHRRIIESCAEAGVRAIVCEKPLADSVKNALAIQKSAKRTVLVLNYQRRFFSLFERARREIASGKLGRIQQVTCYYSNGLYNNGGHTIDALGHLLGDKVAAVSAYRSTRNAFHPEGDHNSDVFLWMKKGATVVMQSVDQSSWGAHEIHIFGEKGAIRLGEYGYSYAFIPARPSVFGGVRQLDERRAVHLTRKESMVAGALLHAIECMQGKDNRSPAAGGVETLRVLEAIRASEKKGKKVPLTHA